MKLMRILAALLAFCLLAVACAANDQSSVPPEAVAAEADESSGGRSVGTPDDAEADSEQQDEDTSSTVDTDQEANDTAPATGNGALGNTDSAPAAAPAGEGEPTESAEAPPSVREAIATASEEPVDVLVSNLIAFVENERGLQFVERPQIDVLDSGDFNDAWSAQVASEVSDSQLAYANYTDIYRALGVLDAGSELAEIFGRFGDAGVLAFYDNNGSIVLRGGELTTFTETVLVHELVGALEDQTFGLDRDEYDARTDEIEWTFSSITEGSARVIEGRYRDGFSQDELAEESAARAAIPNGASFNDLSPSFLEFQFGRHRYGEEFIDALWDAGQAAVDEALQEPPATSEAVVNPSVFLDGEEVLDLALPPADGEVFEQGTWGQAGFAAMLTEIYDRSEAFEITQGWGADRFVAWRDGEITCVRIHVNADSPDALDQYAQALEEWALLGDRQIFFPTADLVRITSCG